MSTRFVHVGLRLARQRNFMSGRPSSSPTPRVALLGSHLSPRSSNNTGAAASSSYSNMTETKSDIHLYTAQTPNGIKVSMLLEELGLPYKVPGPSTNTHRRASPGVVTAGQLLTTNVTRTLGDRHRPDQERPEGRRAVRHGAETRGARHASSAADGS